MPKKKPAKKRATKKAKKEPDMIMVPIRVREGPSKWATAGKGEGRPNDEGPSSALGARVKDALLWDLRHLALHLSQKSGRRVGVATLVEEALRDLLKKYKNA